MDRVKVNQSYFKYPRLKMEHFSFSEVEESLINSSLNRLESMLPNKERVIFSINKYDGLFNGSMRVDELDIYTYGKSPFAIGLFYKLREYLQNKITNRKITLNNKALMLKKINQQINRVL